MTNKQRSANAKVYYSPSLMCGNLINLEKTILEMNSLDIDSLHVDLIDGSFSPSMPLGLEMISKIKELSEHSLDIHIMSNNPGFFIEEILKIGVDSITFHVENMLHLDYYINRVKKTGTKVGLALNPATSLTTLDYVLPYVDKVVLMLINPGYATHASEVQAPYSMKKINDLRKLIDSQQLDTVIQVDGRVSFDVIPDLLRNGANDLVLGSKSLFYKGNTLAENLSKLNLIVSDVESSND